MDPMFFFYLTGGAMLFLVVSMVLGRGHHAGHGPHPGHGGGHGSPGHAHGAGHAQAGSRVTTTGHAGGKTSSPGNMSVLSFQVVFLFIAGFGAGGYFPALGRMGVALTVLGGVLGGIILAAIGYLVMNIFYRHQADSNISSQEYVGLTGIVLTSINGDGVGRVRCEIGTNRDTFLAKSVDQATIPRNSMVRILDMIGSTAIVEITDPTEHTGRSWRR